MNLYKLKHIKIFGRFFCLFALTILASCTYSQQKQFLGAPKTEILIKGSLSVDSFSRLPLDTLGNAPKGAIAQKNGVLYQKDISWNAVGNVANSLVKGDSISFYYPLHSNPRNFVDTAQLNLKLDKSDTALFMSRIISASDTSKTITIGGFTKKISGNPVFNVYVTNGMNTTVSGNPFDVNDPLRYNFIGGSGGSTDTAALSNRINQKQNYSDTNTYDATKSWVLNRNYGDLKSTNSYANPAWITSLAWAKITGVPSFITAETDPIFTGISGSALQVLRKNSANNGYEFYTLPSYLTSENDPTIGSHIKAITPTNISNWNTAYGWGNHAGLYVPLNRTITINGVSYDLSANRSWTISAASETDPVFTAHTVKNISNGTGFLKNTAGTWSYDNSTYALSTHTHNAADITSGTLPIARGGTGLSSMGTALQVLRVNSGGTGLEYFTATYLTSEVDGSTTNELQNLSLGSTTSTTQPVNISSGTGITLPAATTSLAGLLTASDKIKLDGLTTPTGTGYAVWNGTGWVARTINSTNTLDVSNGNGVTFATNIELRPVSGLTPGSYTNATVTVDAYGRVTGASNGTGGGGSYTLPTASATVLGGVKVGAGLAIDGSGVLSVTGGGGGSSYWTANGNHIYNNNAGGVAIGGSSVIGTYKASIFGSIAIDATGSATSSPRVIGIENFNTGMAARVQFGGPLNSFQNSFGGRLQIQSYWGIEINGNNQSASPIGFNDGGTTDASLLVNGRQSTAPILSLKAVNAFSGNYFESVNSTGTTIASLTSSLLTVPNIRIGTSSTTGYVWTATDALGNGAWTAPSGGGGMTSLPNGQIYIGNGSSVATAQTVTGNATLAANGFLTVTGIQAASVPALSTGYLYYNGTSFSWAGGTGNAGTYTPTITLVSNLSGSPIVDAAYYTVDGNVVNVTIEGVVDVVSLNTLTKFYITLPFTANTSYVVGTGTFQEYADGGFVPTFVFGQTSNTASVRFIPKSATSSGRFSIVLTYTK